MEDRRWLAGGRYRILTPLHNLEKPCETSAEAEGITDKSFKMQGVTAILDSGIPLEDVMHHGWWRTLTMPLHYKLNSDKCKKDVAKHV
jgi:hypothetical protein